VDPNRWGSVEGKIRYVHMSGFVCAGSGVVEKQEERVVPVSRRSLTVEAPQHRIHIRLIQISDSWFSGLLEGNGANIRAPRKMFRVMTSDESSHRSDGSKALVTSRNSAGTNGLEVGEKRSHNLS
jgi:hypothetical protein